MQVSHGCAGAHAAAAVCACMHVEEMTKAKEGKDAKENKTVNVHEIALTDLSDIILETKGEDPVNTTVYGAMALLTLQGKGDVKIKHHKRTPADPPEQDGAERYPQAGNGD